MRSMRKFQLISALFLLCLLAALIFQPVKAYPSAQTVPTAGPSRTPQVSSTPEDNSNPPPPTAVLATSSSGGIQPSATSTSSPTLPPTKKPTTADQTETATPQQPTATPTTAATDHPVATQIAQVTEEVLPTMATVVAGAQVSQAGAWCYPIGALILAVLIITIFKRIGSGPKV